MSVNVFNHTRTMIPMRKVVLDSIMSLDGYYTDSKNQIDWFQFEDEDLAWSHDILSRVGLLVFGRTTYVEFSKFWPTVNAKETGWDPFIVEQLNNLPKLVFSTSLEEAAWEPATIVRTDPVKEISRLKKGEGRDINIIGSGSIVAAIVSAGLVDEFRLRIQPVILGSGRLLFKDPGSLQQLTLIDAKPFKTGVLSLHYELHK